MKRLGCAACAAAATAILLATVAGATVFVLYTVGTSSLYVDPPVLIPLPPGLDSETLDLANGPNVTSAYLLVKASQYPDAACNGNMSILLNVGNGYIWPLCWLPYVDNLVPGFSTVSIDPGTYSALLYNDSSGYFLATQEFRGAWIQSFLYPGDVLGDNSSAPHLIFFYYNASVRTLYAYYSFLIRVYILDSSFNVIGYTPWITGYIDNNWHSVAMVYTPSNLSLTGPRAYYVAVFFYVALEPLLIGFGFFDSLYIHMDGFVHLLALQDGLLGLYSTGPILYMVNDTVAGWTANITIHDVAGPDEVLAWYMDPLGGPGSGYAVHYGPGLGLPVEDASANITGDLFGVGVLSVYAYGSAESGSIQLGLSYSNGAAEVEYPVTIEYQDPAPPELLSRAETVVWMEPAGSRAAYTGHPLLRGHGPWCRWDAVNDAVAAGPRLPRVLVLDDGAVLRLPAAPAGLDVVGCCRQDRGGVG